MFDSTPPLSTVILDQISPYPYANAPRGNGSVSVQRSKNSGDGSLELVSASDCILAHPPPKAALSPTALSSDVEPGRSGSRTGRHLSHSHLTSSYCSGGFVLTASSPLPLDPKLTFGTMNTNHRPLQRTRTTPFSLHTGPSYRSCHCLPYCPSWSCTTLVSNSYLSNPIF
jgi:hypothetical protein